MPMLRPFERPVGLLISFLLFFCVSFLPSNVFGQTRQIDSLRAVLPSLPDDSTRVLTLVRLARAHLSLRDGFTQTYAAEAYQLATRINFDKGKASAAVQLGRYFDQQDQGNEAMKYFSEAIAIFRNYGNQDGVAACYNNIGIVYFYQNKYDSAIANYNRSLTLYEALANREEMAKLIGNIGICYDYQGDYTRALELYFQALKMDEETGNQDAIAADYSSIAILYNKQRDFEKSMAFDQKALALYISLNDRYSIASSYVNMGQTYGEMGNFTKALEVLEKALTIFRDLKVRRGESIALHNIGGIYVKQKDYRRAVRYFRNSLDLGDNDNRKLNDFVALAEAYDGLGKPDSALLFAKKGLPIAERLDSHESTYKIARVLYRTYKANNDFKQALFFHEKYLASKDSLFNNEKTSQFRELQTKYETEKKEQQIAVLNSENALQENKLNNRALLLTGSIAVILLIVIFSFVIFRSNRRRQESERQLLNEQLLNEKREAGRLHELDELKSRFFANIAHEFKTPLTLISGPVENLLEDSQDQYMKEQLRLVKRNSERLLKLVNQLLDLSKLESGLAKLELSKENIVPFIKGLTFSFQSLADEKDITLECYAQVDDLRMDFDKDKLEKIVFNLLSNAFKFTPSLGIVRVWIDRVSPDGNDFVEIRVEDSGVGIPQDQILFIFDRFYQADNVHIRNMDGSGIGLALTRELVELHGGRISVESEAGCGTVFIVLLPLRDEAHVKESHPIQQLATAMTDRPVSHETAEPAIDGSVKAEMVLVIEDNAEVREFIIKSLRGDYHVISATHGDEGITMALREIPDLIISDVMMPGKNGNDTCRALKTDVRTSHIPVILLTAKAGLENRIEGLETGADDFIPKPFSTRELRARIKNLITTRKKLREKFLISALTNEKPAAPTMEDAFLVKVREAVEAHLDQAEFSIEELSGELAMSRTQVHRKLKALTNQSASQFMRTIRLQHGRALLQKGHLNISEVAYQVGFSSPTYFSTCYANHFGYAPSDEKADRALSRSQT